MKSPMSRIAAPALFLFSVSLLGGSVGVEAQSEQASVADVKPPNWEGLWVAERTFGPDFDGPVTLHRVANHQGAGGPEGESKEVWIARVQGETSPVQQSKALDGVTTWSFEFAEHGRFEGWQENGGAAIDGHWLQAPGVMAGYPIATPVRLEPSGSAAFRGEIVPFRDEVSLNIPLIAEAGSESGGERYRTFLRNPQRNLGVFFRIESATAVVQDLHFANSDGETLAVARGTEPGERFTLVFPRFGETLDFTRRTRQNAPGFYPRRDPTTPSTFPRPVAVDDGWQTATPSESGLDEQPLRRLVTSIAEFEPTALRQPYIHALLIAHRGKLVVEEYFHGYHRERTHDSRSAGKSLASALLGVALHQGLLPSLDQLVYPLFGGVDVFANPDPRKERMTVRHLATMTSGFHCDDDNYENPGNEDVMQSQSDQPDWYRYALDLPMVREPGEAGVYCTGGINLIGGVLQRVTDTSLTRFFHEEFAQPLNISYYQMNLSPTYSAYMGGGIRLRPRDFLKLGQLYLDEGVWNGRRIVSKEWVRASASAHASLNEEHDYGYAWWRRTYEVGSKRVDTFYASGNGGQMVFVVPDLDLVALIHAGNYSDGRTRNQFRDEYMQNSILPAAIKLSR